MPSHLVVQRRLRRPLAPDNSVGPFVAIADYPPIPVAAQWSSVDDGLTDASRLCRKCRLWLIFLVAGTCHGTVVIGDGGSSVFILTMVVVAWFVRGRAALIHIVARVQSCDSA